MIDLMLLAGSALCAISVVLAVVSVAQTRAPRVAAITLVLGLALLFGAAWLRPAAVGPQQVLDAWQRLLADKPLPPGTDAAAP
ncbi:hypothetical protein [uncultured Paracoccus sp.]|uniref:hypothetical protein n=1 Tax=uncultured Paracoccus sp. TaxID=189685 RepID=UPI0025F635D4|nr:hypothetical protein [uncultured Paracoccus sp.]